MADAADRKVTRTKGAAFCRVVKRNERQDFVGMKIVPRVSGPGFSKYGVACDIWLHLHVVN